MSNEIRQLNNDDLMGFYEAVYEQLGDTESQHNAEVAHYGDSWPGAQIQIQEMKEWLAELEAEIDRRKLIQ